MKDDRFYLLDILDSIDWIETVGQSGHAAFIAARIPQDAVLRNFQVIGEATTRISDGIKQAYPDIPWRRMPDCVMCSSTTYRSVDLEVVWSIMDREVPVLRQQITAILRELNAQAQAE